MKCAALLILCISSMLAAPVQAANIVIQNNDGALEGFNDPNPPVNGNQIGNNPGTTLGELRLNVFNAVAQRWGELLNSNVTITVNAQFNALSCSEFSGTLGQAGATSNFANFSGGVASVAYHVALAESLANANLNGGNAEINATFNSTVDTGDVNCLGGGGFYYGLDGNAPVGTAALFPVVLHELAHGLSFGHLADVGPGGSGAFTGSGGFPDTFSRNLQDVETGKSWDTMSDPERLASAVNDPDLTWKGAQVTADRDQFLDPAPEVVINAPPGIIGTHPAALGEEPTIILSMAGVTADLVDGDALVVDPCNNTDAQMNGKIILYELPAGCIPAIPAFLAQLNNATGVIIANSAASGLPDMSGQIGNQEVTIPYVGVTQSVGNNLRNNIGTANATIRESATVLNGDQQGKLRMFAPAAFVEGSSVSHWTGAARPDLLMESALGQLQFNEVDLTLAAFADMGWSVNFDLDEIIFEDGFESP